MREQDSQIDAAKERMLQGLLAEVRRVRRRRRVRAASGVAAIAMLAVGAATLWSPRGSGTTALPAQARRPQPAGAISGAESTSATNPREAVTLLDERGRSVASAPSVRVEIVSSRPGERLIVADAEPSIRVDMITTEQAYALIQTTGQRYGLVEYPGHVEFVQLAAK